MRKTVAVVLLTLATMTTAGCSSTPPLTEASATSTTPAGTDKVPRTTKAPPTPMPEASRTPVTQPTTFNGSGTATDANGYTYAADFTFTFGTDPASLTAISLPGQTTLDYNSSAQLTLTNTASQRNLPIPAFTTFTMIASFPSNSPACVSRLDSNNNVCDVIVASFTIGGDDTTSTLTPNETRTLLADPSTVSGLAAPTDFVARGIPESDAAAFEAAVQEPTKVFVIQNTLSVDTQCEYADGSFTTGDVVASTLPSVTSNCQPYNDLL